MLIKGAASQSGSDATMPSGTLVMYENDGVALLGVLGEFKKDKFVVLNEREREVELQAKRLHRLPGMLPESMSNKGAKSKYLSELHQRCRARAGETNLAELWEFVREKPRDYKTGELCQLYLGNDTLEPHLALRIALLGDRIYFKRKNEFFVPRAAEVVEELRKAEVALQKKRELQDSAVKFFKERINNPRLAIPPELLGTVHLLEDVAAAVPDIENSKLKDAKEILSLFEEAADVQLPGAKEHAAFNLLERIHHFGPDTNLVIVHYKPRMIFPKEVLDQAQGIADPDSDSSRIDLTRVRTITIDDSSTKDMDDALSLERLPNGNFRLGIHISDVAAAIEAASPLDSEACARGTSIYCQKLTINMLPETLSESALSLVKDHLRACVSCLYELDRNCEIVSSQICRTFIKVQRRLSYNEVDDLLENGDAELAEYHHIAAHLEAGRIEAGATKVHKRDVEVLVQDNGDFTLAELDENTPARSLINEMMVLANTTIAQYGTKNNLPLVFRCQEAPDSQDLKAYEKIPQGPAYDYAMRARLKRSVVSFSPGLHWSLGLKAYVHCTSPIRRYVDLCNQRQVVSYLTGGKPFYTQEQLEEILHSLEEKLHLAQSVGKETKRMWLQRHLQKHFLTKRTVRGTVIRIDLKTPLVELDEVYMPVLVRFNRAVKLGEEVALKISAVDPRYDYLRLEEVS